MRDVWNVVGVFGRIATAAVICFAAVARTDAMEFTWRAPKTVHATGAIEIGDAAKFAALATFDTLELDSPGGFVGEALAIAARMDERGGIRTVVKAGASCASACAMAIFVSGERRIVHMGGRLGIHSCAMPDGTQAPECNKAMAANATAHGVPWGVIEGFGNYTKPSIMMWLGAEDAECWGLMKWGPQDTSNDGVDCFKWASRIPTPDITSANAKSADYIACRANAGTSRTSLSTSVSGQGFSNAYRAACKRVVADPKTPRYAAVDIIMWLTLTDPQVLTLKPGTLMVNILDRDENQIGNCWKCVTIIAMSELMNGYPKQAVEDFKKAVALVKRDDGSVPAWLTSRVDLAAAEAAKKDR
ncbi:hypothetical protein IVA93_15545 [Bradyrhizobium sp. 155]|uniref:hypothetical protein n=1 Tax=Bradyrhizobium sp. 155 TaxID=2782629 RepID=UPI001FFF20CF|nr:hypothetical protein [Bradyrhizobium sp. 155]UPK14476.1 hypothetical protein IVA93_15545 [Bradyrhizobium sp. 155]